MDKIYDLLILGSGPAGLAAGIYAERARLDAMVIEKEYVSGGQVVNTYEVDNYPGLPGINGFDMGMKFREHADGLGVNFVTDKVERVEAPGKEDLTGECGSTVRSGGDAAEQPVYRVVCENETYAARTLIIATGAVHRKLGVPGEEEMAGMGVSYCATCDGAFFRNKDVAVVGGGDVAIEDAIFLARACRRVYVIHRRDELRGAKSLQEKLLRLPNVEMLWNTVVEKIEGDGQVSGLTVRNVKTGEISALPLQGVFVAVGIVPNSGIFEGLVEMDHGYIVADETGRTSAPGIFAAGDVRTKALRQIVTAVSDGANAVASVEKYLAG